jgi:MFS family permease
MLCLAFSNMDRSVLSLLIVPIEKTFALDDTTLSLIQGAAFSLFYAGFGIFLSRAADTSHRRNLILFGLIVWCFATIGCGLAVGAKTLFAARVVVALGEAVLFPAGVSILADYFTASSRGRALAVYSMGSVLGPPLSLVVGGGILHAVGKTGYDLPIVGHLEGWRMVFVLVGATGLVLAPCLLGVREPPRLDESGRADDEKMSFREALGVLGQNRRAVVATIGGFALVAVAGASIQVWLPTILIRNHHWAASSTGVKLGALAATVGLASVFTAGFVSDAVHARGHWAARPAIAAVCALGGILAALLITLPSDAAALSGAVLSYFCVSFATGLAQAAIAQLLPNRVRGLGSALFIATTNLLLATGGTLLIGLLTDHVFHDPQALPLSIRIVTPALYALAIGLLVSGLGAYRKVLEGQQARTAQA